MRGELKKEGKYKLFKTTKGNQILNLDDKEFYALVEGQQGDIIVKSDADHKKSENISTGKYFYADFDNDPEFQDMPHLFIQEGTKYREMIMPQGFPNNKDHQKKLVRTREKIAKSKVIEHVKGKGNKGGEKQYQDKKEGLRNKTKTELYDLAKKYKIKNRSKMNKESLVKKLHQTLNA